VLADKFSRQCFYVVYPVHLRGVHISSVIPVLAFVRPLDDFEAVADTYLIAYHVSSRGYELHIIRDCYPGIDAYYAAVDCFLAVAFIAYADVHRAVSVHGLPVDHTRIVAPHGAVVERPE